MSNPTRTFTSPTSVYRADQWANAVGSLAKAVELKGSKPGAHECFFLAMCHWQLGDKGASQQWYDKAIAYMKGTEAARSKNKTLDDELTRLRAEVEVLLGKAVETSRATATPPPPADAKDK